MGQETSTSSNIQDAVDFSGLILGFSSAALHSMGVVDVEGRPLKVNLSLARQNIEIIKMLSEKTRGNLTADETHLIDQLINDLQVKLVEASR